MADKGKDAQDYTRVRVSFSPVAGKQLADLADRIGVDVPTLVRMMTLFQLQQWRAMANPGLLMVGNPELQQRFVANLVEAMPELREVGLGSDDG